MIFPIYLFFQRYIYCSYWGKQKWFTIFEMRWARKMIGDIESIERTWPGTILLLKQKLCMFLFIHYYILYTTFTPQQLRQPLKYDFPDLFILSKIYLLFNLRGTKVAYYFRDALGTEKDRWHWKYWKNVTWHHTSINCLCVCVCVCMFCYFLFLFQIIWSFILQQLRQPLKYDFPDLFILSKIYLLFNLRETKVVYYFRDAPGPEKDRWHWKYNYTWPIMKHHIRVLFVISQHVDTGQGGSQLVDEVD